MDTVPDRSGIWATRDAKAQRSRPRMSGAQVGHTTELEPRMFSGIPQLAQTAARSDPHRHTLDCGFSATILVLVRRSHNVVLAVPLPPTGMPQYAVEPVLR